VDVDMANDDQTTIFVNHKVFDYSGCYIGATGIGLSLNIWNSFTKVVKTSSMF